jgi:hypothetical protein
LLETREVDGVQVTILPGKFRAEGCLPGYSTRSGFFEKLFWGENSLGSRYWFFDADVAKDVANIQNEFYPNDMPVAVGDIGDSGIYIVFDAGDLGG